MESRRKQKGCNEEYAEVNSAVEETIDDYISCINATVTALEADDEDYSKAQCRERR